MANYIQIDKENYFESDINHIIVNVFSFNGTKIRSESLCDADTTFFEKKMINEKTKINCKFCLSVKNKLK